MRVRPIGRSVAWAGAVLALAPLAGMPARADGALCQPSDPAAVALAAQGLVGYTDEPTAGRWRTWTVEPQDVLVPAPPRVASPQHEVELAEVKRAATTRDAATTAEIRRWGEGAATAPWSRLMIELLRRYSSRPDRNPPRISRQIAILETATFDALVVAWNAKYCHLRPPPSTLDPTIPVEGDAPAAPSYPSEHGVAAGVASVVLEAFFPEEEAADPQHFENLALGAALTRIAAGTSYRSDVMQGYALGRAVAWRVLASRAGDGWDAVWDGSGRITGKCNWSPTPPAYQPNPVEPLWGRVRPWVMPSGSALRPPPPPACDGDEYKAAARDLHETSLTLTDRQKEIALYWAGGPGTETPPGMNLGIALDAAEDHGMRTMRHARVLAHVGAGLADAAIAAWDAKFAYWSDRPVTTIRRLWDRDWTSFIGTPPFPGYVSGHSTFSGTAAAVLGYFFPEDAVRFRALATEAAMSRFYGGIHVRYDNEDGLWLGDRLGALVAARAATDRA